MDRPDPDIIIKQQLESVEMALTASEAQLQSTEVLLVTIKKEIVDLKAKQKAYQVALRLKRPPRKLQPKPEKKGKGTDADQ